MPNGTAPFPAHVRIVSQGHAPLLLHFAGDLALLGCLILNWRRIAAGIDLPTAANTRAELTRKLKDYFANGVRLMWVIHPRRWTAEVYTAPRRKTSIDESGTLHGGDVLPGFRLPLAKLFERLEKPKPKKRKK